ncbi:hypothetical protein LEP1GSC121_2818 [Leptospira borgpetersenii serovar Castellonis str. 200801910]|nr:hypothetical protein LEP1GSC121_2818 [Leptospira borgpetersenii serovar Castellonis str. 200801910]
MALLSLVGQNQGFLRASRLEAKRTRWSVSDSRSLLKYIP